MGDNRGTTKVNQEYSVSDTPHKRFDSDSGDFFTFDTYPGSVDFQQDIR